MLKNDLNILPVSRLSGKPRLLVSGCSFTKDKFQKTWPDYLAEAINYDMINAAARGAGIDYIRYRIMYECAKYIPDLVVIMLPSVDRFDLFVEPSHPLKEEIRSICSWQDGIGPGFLDLDGNNNPDYGFCLSGGEHRGYKKNWFKHYYSKSGALLKYWTDVLGLINFFQNNKINCRFISAYDKDHMVEQDINTSNNQELHQYLYHWIDWDQFIFYKDDQGFLSFVKDHGYEIQKHHPVTQAHQAWVDKILLPNLHL